MSVGSSLSNATVAIGGTAALIVAGRPTRKGLRVQHVHATQILYLGSSSSVTTSNGLKVAAGGDTGDLLMNFNGPLYGIASGADTDVRVFEVF